MICPKCKFEQSSQHIECPRCGIIFEKYHLLQQRLSKNEKNEANPSETSTEEIAIEEKPLTPAGFIKKLLFYVEPFINPFYFGGRAIVFLIICIWGLIFIFTPMESNYTGESFLHLVNLPFHEAGHIIFRPFGAFITSLGGSLGQLLMPLICLTVFLTTSRDTFGASVAFWWFGQNFMDMAPYINDARAGRLPLLGGNTGHSAPYGFHDWEYILNESGLIQYDHVLAHISYKTGTLVMILAIIWGGFLLFRQYKNLDSQ